MKENITWSEQLWEISKLHGNQRNPRKISPERFEKLKRKITSLGYHHPVACQPDGLIISGHQRVRALTELGHKKIRVSIPSRTLDAQEYKAMMIQTNITDGEWEKSILEDDFESEELEQWGLSASESGLFKSGSLDQQGKLDESKGKIVQTCPNCNHSFTA